MKDQSFKVADCCGQVAVAQFKDLGRKEILQRSLLKDPNILFAIADDLLKPLQSFLFRERRQSRRIRIVSIEKHDVIDRAFRPSLNAWHACCRQLNCHISAEAAGHRLRFHFRKELGCRFAKSHRVRISSDHAAWTLSYETTGIVGQKGPAAARASIGKGRLASARVSAQKHSTPLETYARSVNRSEIQGLQ